MTMPSRNTARKRLLALAPGNSANAAGKGSIAAGTGTQATGNHAAAVGGWFDFDVRRHMWHTVASPWRKTT